MIQLSPNFSLDEMTRSQVGLRAGIGNNPNDAQVANLKRLCTLLLEPARIILGVPEHIDSGFRSPALNAAVRGAADSAHMDGRAADVIPVGASLRSAFDALRRSVLPFDQIIIECGAWLHMAVAPDGRMAKHEAMTGSWDAGNKRWAYTVLRDD